MPQRLLVVSPVRNEAAHIERVALAIAAQTRPPDLWLAIDDRSSDRTAEILAELASRIEFMEVRQSPAHAEATEPTDRLALAVEARAFNLALNSIDWGSYTHVAKLDGDIELPVDYFERLLEEFARDPALGLAGGVLRERSGVGWAREHRASEYHVRGALKCYTTECLREIGGIQERMAWDTIDEVCARMHGYATRSLAELVALHHRPAGSADGYLRGRARHGTGFYILHYPFTWVLLRSFKAGAEPPVGLSGIAFLCGYIRAALRRVPRVEDPRFRAFLHRELSGRARRALRSRALRRLEPGRSSAG